MLCFSKVLMYFYQKVQAHYGLRQVNLYPERRAGVKHAIQVSGYCLPLFGGESIWSLYTLLALFPSLGHSQSCPLRNLEEPLSMLFVKQPLLPNPPHRPVTILSLFPNISIELSQNFWKVVVTVPLLDTRAQTLWGPKPTILARIANGKIRAWISGPLGPKVGY